MGKFVFKVNYSNGGHLIVNTNFNNGEVDGEWKMVKVVLGSKGYQHKETINANYKLGVLNGLVTIKKYDPSYSTEITQYFTNGVKDSVSKGISISGKDTTYAKVVYSKGRLISSNFKYYDSDHRFSKSEELFIVKPEGTIIITRSLETGEKYTEYTYSDRYMTKAEDFCDSVRYLNYIN